jgi:hypothetical protein
MPHVFLPAWRWMYPLRPQSVFHELRTIQYCEVYPTSCRREKRGRRNEEGGRRYKHYE